MSADCRHGLHCVSAKQRKGGLTVVRGDYRSDWWHPVAVEQGAANLWPDFTESLLRHSAVQNKHTPGEFIESAEEAAAKQLPAE